MAMSMAMSISDHKSKNGDQLQKALVKCEAVFDNSLERSKIQHQTNNHSDEF